MLRQPAPSVLHESAYAPTPGATIPTAPFCVEICAEAAPGSASKAAVVSATANDLRAFIPAFMTYLLGLDLPGRGPGLDQEA
jgi:hypothetical protein